MGEVEDLNYDFSYNLFLAKSTMQNLKTLLEKQRVMRWLRKLSGSNRTLTEMRLRNEFMYHLVLNIQAGQLRAPFVDNPPAGPLPTFSQMLPGGSEGVFTGQIDPTSGMWSGYAGAASASAQRPMLYKNSPDGGVFLAAQPIPKCGAFCYMAVVNKPKPESTE